jgi:ubiquinone/menaquinone biosynthesis C-methylase UbiE
MPYVGGVGLLGRIYDWQLPLERAALAAAAELAAPSKSDRLLDVATGTGGLLRELSRRGRLPAEVVGIDRSRSMLAVALANGLPAGWRLLESDAESLPFQDERFDVVTACYLLHLLDREARARTIAELARVVVPGGRVVTVTVESRRPAARAALARLPKRSGLRPLDPSQDLRAAGLEPHRASFVRDGWPSLCVLAQRRPGQPPPG